MESVLGRYRNLIILVGVLFLQVLGLAVQVKRGNDSENTRLIRIWAVDAITPFERGLVSLQEGVSGIWHNYVYLRGVRAENRDLEKQIEQMRLQEVRLSEDAAQARRLQSLLSFKEQVVAKTVAAQVIGSSGSDLSRAVYIDKGSDQGLAPDMAVITANGIVGKILRVYPSTSLVLLINDQSSGVGVILEKSRLQGGLRGTANGQVILEHIMSDEDVKPGETVLTSGGDRIFPKGLPVGTVSQVKNGKETFLDIRVKPYADLSRLEEVLVVTQKQDRQAVADEGQHTRAADILAQRLPSVPDAPPATPISSVPASAVSNTAPVQPKTAAGTQTTPGSTLQPKSATGTPAATQPVTGTPSVKTTTPPSAAGTPPHVTDANSPPAVKPGQKPTTKQGIPAAAPAKGQAGRVAQNSSIQPKPASPPQTSNETH